MSSGTAAVSAAQERLQTLFTNMLQSCVLAVAAFTAYSTGTVNSSISGSSSNSTSISSESSAAWETTVCSGSSSNTSSSSSTAVQEALLYTLLLCIDCLC
jgi:hypothetical protein